MNPSDAPGPLLRTDGSPVFEHGWQAQVLALAFNLVERGQFSAADWSQALGAELRRSTERNEPDNPNSYYQAVLSALEGLLQRQNSLSCEALDSRTEAWRAAYLRTPHGQPVEL